MLSKVLISTFLWYSICVQPFLTQVPDWVLATTSPVFGETIELKCTVTGDPTCCTGLRRIWRKVVSGTVTQIMNNGTTDFPSKYSETVDDANNQFSLFISSLSESDVDIDYVCRYGNLDQKTLTMDSNYIYRPTASCQVKADGDDLVSTLSVAKAAPSPTVNASYGGSDWSSYLTVTGPSPIAGNTKFYTIGVSLNRECTCDDDEKFTLSVLTASGTVTKNICDQVDICQCGKCAGQCFGYSVLGTVIVLIGGVVIMKFVLKVTNVKKIVKVVAIIGASSLVIDVIVAVPICYTVCPCRCKNGGKDPIFIVLGIVVTVIITPIVILVMPKGTSENSTGSSCWPQCRVDQEPENPRSGQPAVEKPREKPVAVIRSQPPQPKTKHIKTENDEKEKLSYENKGFNESGMAKARPLPPLTKIQGSSPRPLPAMPNLPSQSNQVQLAPLETSVQKKKRKKKKKPEQSDDSN